MWKAFLVAKKEYLKMVRKRTFLLSTLGVPFLIIGVSVLGAVIALGGGSDAPIGYVDRADILSTDVDVPPPTNESEAMDEMPFEVEVRSYPTEDAAREALGDGEIQGYYVIAEDYLSTGQLTLVYGEEEPGETVKSGFRRFIRANLVSQLPEDVAARAYHGIQLTVRSLDGQREASGFDIIGGLLPFAAGMFFFLAVTISAQYLMRAVTDEKENRTMEILISSVSPEQLIGGKAVGLIGVALTQVLIWLVTVVIGVLIASRFIEELRSFTVPWAFLGVSALYFLPSFALVAGLMVAIGGVVTEIREGQQIAGILNMLFVFPYFLAAAIFARPDGILATILSLFPTTAYTTIALRWGIGTVPLWQLIASWVIVVGSAFLSIVAASRIFRAGMLHYGQPLKLQSVLAALRGQ